MEDLTRDERSITRSELIQAIGFSGGMAKDARTPRVSRDYYKARVEQLHRLYLKLGGHLTTQEILR